MDPNGEEYYYCNSEYNNDYHHREYPNDSDYMYSSIITEEDPEYTVGR